MKKHVDETPFIQKWNYSTGVKFKSFTTEHQDQVLLRHTTKIDMESSK